MAANDSYKTVYDHTIPCKHECQNPSSIESMRLPKEKQYWYSHELNTTHCDSSTVDLFLQLIFFHICTCYWWRQCWLPWHKQSQRPLLRYRYDILTLKLLAIVRGSTILRIHREFLKISSQISLQSNPNVDICLKDKKDVALTTYCCELRFPELQRTTRSTQTDSVTLSRNK